MNRVETDVLVIGGGIAGPWAAIEAARRGASVTLIEESDNLSSGPSGCDHWGPALDNPCSKITPDEYLEIVEAGYRGYLNGIMEYVNCNDGYRALIELEKMGGKIRDDADEFKGAPFKTRRRSCSSLTTTRTCTPSGSGDRLSSSPSTERC